MILPPPHAMKKGHNQLRRMTTSAPTAAMDDSEPRPNILYTPYELPPPTRSLATSSGVLFPRPSRHSHQLSGVRSQGARRRKAARHEHPQVSAFLGQ